MWLAPHHPAQSSNPLTLSRLCAGEQNANKNAPVRRQCERASSRPRKHKTHSVPCPSPSRHLGRRRVHENNIHSARASLVLRVRSREFLNPYGAHPRTATPTTTTTAATTTLARPTETGKSLSSCANKYGRMRFPLLSAPNYAHRRTPV